MTKHNWDSFMWIFYADIISTLGHYRDMKFISLCLQIVAFLRDFLMCKMCSSRKQSIVDNPNHFILHCIFHDQYQNRQDKSHFPVKTQVHRWHLADLTKYYLQKSKWQPRSNSMRENKCDSEDLLCSQPNEHTESASGKKIN